MGVMKCDRKDCENIMCDHLILNSSAYLCNSCYEELLEYRKTWVSRLTAAEVKEKVETFMQSRIGEYRELSGTEIEDEFRRLLGEERNEEAL